MLSKRKNWIITGLATACLVTGIALSHLIEPGVSVQKLTLADDTPALKFLPAGAGPHPVALLAHGYAGSKETLFRYGEALAAAGFICYSVDQPGHGASPRTFTFVEAVHTLEAVAREVGPVDVFAGQSMGGGTGSEAVRKGGVKPGLFIAVGAFPVLGDHAPALLLLSGRFEEAFMLLHITPALLKTRTEARLVISPWSDHLLGGFDPVLVNAAVEAACAAVHKTPPPPPTAWRWRLLGAVLAMLAAGWLASCLTDLFPQSARIRGLSIGVFITVAFMLTFTGRWLDATPHLRLQGIAVPVTFLLAVIAGKLRIPRWSFAALGVLAMAIALCWFKASLSWAAFVFYVWTVLLMPALIAGTVIAWVAARRGSRLQGDIAMAIFVGCAPFQCLEPPRTPSEAPKPHIAIKLDAKLLDACIGEYEFAPDTLFFTGMKLTIRRNGDHLVGRSLGRNTLPGALDFYPESETNFFVKINCAQLTFIKNDKGEVTAVIHHYTGLPDSEGKKVSGVATGTNDAATVDPAVYDSLVGRYDYGKLHVLRVTRAGDHLFAQFAGRNCEIFPKSETEYFWKVMDAQVTFVKDDRGKVTKAIYHQGGGTIVGRKITSLERFWLSLYARWFGAAALLYAFYIGIVVSIRDRVPFQIMREFFHSLPRNFAGCFKGWNIARHFVAIGLGVVLVTSGFDWFYLSATRSPQLLAWMIPGINLGVWVPLALPPSLLLAGMAFKRAPITRSGWALAQVALIGFVLTELIKAVTGRPQPPFFMGPDTSHVFHFGLLRSEMVSGWPSGHTIIALAMSVTLFWLFPKKRWLGAAALLYAFYIGLSVSMTVHWFADFASGIIFGIVVGTTVGRSFAAMELKDKWTSN